MSATSFARVAEPRRRQAMARTAAGEQGRIRRSRRHSRDGQVASRHCGDRSARKSGRTRRLPRAAAARRNRSQEACSSDPQCFACRTEKVAGGPSSQQAPPAFPTWALSQAENRGFESRSLRHLVCLSHAFLHGPRRTAVFRGAAAHEPHLRRALPVTYSAKALSRKRSSSEPPGRVGCLHG